MAFTSSLLMKNMNPTTELQNLVEGNNDRPYIYDLLEFNSDMQDLDFVYKIEQYRLMTEAIRLNDNNQDLSVVYEGLLSNTFKKLAEIIRKIIDSIKEIVNSFANSFDKKRFEKASTGARNKYYDFKAGRAKHSETIFTKKATFAFYRYPDVRKMDLDSIKKCIKNLVTTLRYTVNGDDVEYDKLTLRNAFRSLKRSVEACSTSIRQSTVGEIPVDNNVSFLSFIREQVCYVEEKKMSILDWCSSDLLISDDWFPSDPAYEKAMMLFDKDLRAAKDVLDRTNNPTLPEENKKLARIIVSDIQTVTNAYKSFIKIAHSYHKKSIDYRIRVMERICNDDKYQDSYVDESAMIHGEPFNSDTLFGNEDLRDFNRTEWLDLNLTMEFHNMKYELTEGRKTIAIKEALIISDEESNKVSRLQAMREAEEKKTNSKIAAIIDTIKKILNKFIESMKSKFSTTGIYIRTNKRYIDKPIQLNSMTSTGDILAGMYRIQDKINIIPFNYESMKDDLKDKKTFFKNKILPGLNKKPQCSKRKLEWTDDMDVSTYCKIYYGAHMPKDNYPVCEFNSSDMESNKSNIVRFLSEENICFSAKADINSFEAQCKKITITAPSSNTTTTNNDKPENDTTSNESVYYSELYERWITEADIDMGNVQNGEGTSNPNPNNDVYNAYRVYTDCYKDVLFAKMTGSEFAFSELMQLISMHVAKNGGPKMTMGQKDNNQNQSNNK